ncbi:unnamed protein product [Phytomonas sp. EM1]|nr:unnamed protein product [Phytomonas sp. EM1]|eukprot:CCW60193.1 unnamed protein product [Phytomonas sp. isolate EM1]
MGKRERERSSSIASSLSSSSSTGKTRKKNKKSKVVSKEKNFELLTQHAKHARDERERKIEEYLQLKKRKSALGEDTNSESGTDSLEGLLPHLTPNQAKDEDLLSSDASLLSSFSSTKGDDTEEEEEEEEDIQDRLLEHAKATSLALKASAMPELSVGPTSRDASFAETPAARLRSAQSDPVASTFQQLAVALRKPVRPPMSTALTVVNAAEESERVLSAVLQAKLPPLPASEGKKLRRLRYIDHRTVAYRAIRKDFYVVSPEVRALSEEARKGLLRELDGAKLRGRDPPPPLLRWDATGLPDRLLEVLQRRGFDAPFAVQSVGLPCLMAGRDLLVTAKTGSGKTLAYALPLVRHCVDQGRCGKGEGPVGLILVPTQELAGQVDGLVRELCEAVGLRAVASYGSTPLAENIRAAKAGCEVMTCTPGRLLDLLTVNNGNSVTLRRVSFVVVDEADRLFDSGFMEHVEAFLKNIRPDAQVAMISATMPRPLKKIVTEFMHDPIEITVGGRPTPASNVEQRFYFFKEEVYEFDVEKRKESERFVKLMQILGEECDAENQRLILIFVQRREEVDEIMAKLSSLGYRGRVATLYSGMDPIDREFALEHFTPGKQFILVATAVAERGLDIPFLDLVINYTLPNHYEAYVHRIGRTGRAGRKGHAISFFVHGKDDDIALELVDGLVRAEQHVPEELFECATKMRELRRDGKANSQASFYRGYLKAKKQLFMDINKKEQVREAAKAAGLDGYLSSEEGIDSDVESNAGGESDIVPVSASTAASNAGDAMSTALTLRKADVNGALVLSSQQEDRIAKALAFAKKTTEAETSENGDDIRFQVEYPINDLSNVVRGKLQSAAFLRSVMEETNTSIVKKGVYYDPKYKYSQKLKETERPLYFLIIGKTTEAVQSARLKLNEMRDKTISQQRAKASSTGAVL